MQRNYVFERVKKDRLKLEETHLGGMREMRRLMINILDQCISNPSSLLAKALHLILRVYSVVL